MGMRLAELKAAMPRQHGKTHQKVTAISQVLAVQHGTHAVARIVPHNTCRK
jgi:hypothetical protein